MLAVLNCPWLPRTYWSLGIRWRLSAAVACCTWRARSSPGIAGARMKSALKIGSVDRGSLPERAGVCALMPAMTSRAQLRGSVNARRRIATRERHALT